MGLSKAEMVFGPVRCQCRRSHKVFGCVALAVFNPQGNPQGKMRIWIFRCQLHGALKSLNSFCVLFQVRMRHAHIVVDFHARRVFLGSSLQQDQRFPGPALLQQPEPLGTLPTYASAVS